MRNIPKGVSKSGDFRNCALYGGVIMGLIFSSEFPPMQKGASFNNSTGQRTDIEGSLIGSGD